MDIKTIEVDFQVKKKFCITDLECIALAAIRDTMKGRSIPIHQGVKTTFKEISNLVCIHPYSVGAQIKGLENKHVIHVSSENGFISISFTEKYLEYATGISNKILATEKLMAPELWESATADGMDFFTFRLATLIRNEHLMNRHIVRKSVGPLLFGEKTIPIDPVQRDAINASLNFLKQAKYIQ